MLSDQPGITNYKAMGATTRGSLVMVVNPQATPPYGTMTPIPGTCRFIPMVRYFQATAYALPTFWTAFRIPSSRSKRSTRLPAAGRLAKRPRWSACRRAVRPRARRRSRRFNYFVPPGFDGKFGPDSAVAKAGLRTFLAYDFSPRGADAGKYEDPGFGKTPPAYGPSSMHPAVVICGMGDGSVQAISKQIDAANLFFLITKNNSDPFYIP